MGFRALKSIGWSEETIEFHWSMGETCVLQNSDSSPGKQQKQ